MFWTSNLIDDKITYIYCVLNEFNPAFEVQKMGNKAFQNVSFHSMMGKDMTLKISNTNKISIFDIPKV